MKKILPVFIALAFCSFIPARVGHKNSATAETGTVYVYRVGQFNMAANNWAVFADGVKVCKISNNKFLKLELPAGKHEFHAKIGGAVLFKKETGIEVDVEAGGNYYIACNIKQSFTRPRLELLEVTKSTGSKQMEKMTLDNCQEKIDAQGADPADEK